MIIDLYHRLMRNISLFIVCLSLTGCCCGSYGLKKDMNMVLKEEKHLLGTYHYAVKDFFQRENELSSGAGALLKKEFAKEHLDTFTLFKDFEDILCPAP